MSRLKFSDGEEFNTSGELRKEYRSDGWYILGKGMLIPAKDEKECDDFILGYRVNVIKKSDNPRKEFFNQINNILKF